MAIIKCPECGRDVSDMAPTCPHCGVEIAGKTVENPQPQQPKKKKRKGCGVLIASFIIALIACGAGFYVYQESVDDREMQEYEFAAKSDDPLVLQSFIDTYKDAPQAHRETIEKRLQQIRAEEQEWQDAWISNSKTMLADFLRNHPDSPHRALAAQRIDSLDWAKAASVNTVDAYQQYLTEHPDGEHYDEAEGGMKAIKVKEITTEERNMISQLFRRFFLSINERNEAELVSTVADELMLLNKRHAGKEDVIGMMNRMYKDGVVKLLWRINKDYKIDKREVGDDQYEYTVSFTVDEEVETADSEQKAVSQYRVNAKVAPDNRISELRMSKLIK